MYSVAQVSANTRGSRVIRGLVRSPWSARGNSIGTKTDPLPMRSTHRRVAFARAASTVFLVAAAFAQEWQGYERLNREQLLERLASADTAVPSLAGKNFSALDLSAVDFRRANLSASVFNQANLSAAKLDHCNLTVAFLEGANLSDASL